MFTNYVSLQQRSLSHEITYINLSSCMDIIAIATSNEILTIYRTISWEKIHTLALSDVSAINSSQTISSMSFNPTSTIMAIGFSDGSLGLLNIESSHYKSIDVGQETKSLIKQLVWNTLVNSSDFSNIYDESIAISLGGYNQVEKFGMIELNDSLITSNENITDIIKLTSFQLLLSFSSEGIITGYINGLFTYFSINVNNIMTSNINDSLADSRLDNNFDYSKQIFSTTNHCGITILTPNHETNYNLSDIYLSNSKELSYDYYLWYQLFSKNILILENDINTINDIIISHHKKWKDSTKVLLAKLGLLQSSMKGYNLDYTAIEFMYTIVQCGAWHPAATASFPSQWNDQGIIRLKSTIENTLTSIIKQLQFRVIPLLTNSLLRCRELLGISSFIFDSDEPNNLDENLVFLLACIEELLLLVERTIDEARLTKESMLIYLQFIKEQSTDLQDSSNQSFQPDYSLREKYAELFNPRSYRALESGKHAQAETVTATHLYYYIDITNDTINPFDHISIHSRVIEGPSQNDITINDGVNKILQLLDDITFFHNTTNNKLQERIKDMRYQCQRSPIIKQIKIVKDSINEINIITKKLISESIISSNQIQSNLIINESLSLSTIPKDSLIISDVTINLINSNIHLNKAIITIFIKKSNNEVIINIKSINSYLNKQEYNTNMLDQSKNSIFKAILNFYELFSDIIIIKDCKLYYHNNIISLIVGISYNNSSYIIKIDLNNIIFNRIDNITSNLSKSISLNQNNCTINQLNTIKTTKSLDVSSSRGVVAVIDNGHNITIIDIENVEEEIEDEDNIDEEK